MIRSRVLFVLFAFGCRSGAEPATAVSARAAEAQAVQRAPQAPAEATAGASQRSSASPALSRAATPPAGAAPAAPSAALASPTAPRDAASPAPAEAAVEPSAASAPLVGQGSTPAAPSARTKPEPPKKRVAPAPEPEEGTSKVLIVGDSMAATDFGRALQKRLQAHAKLSAVRRGKSSTGLARPDFFDWMSEAERQLRRHDPDLVVVIIGGNDGQDLIPKEKGRRVHWNKPKWKDAYAARVQAFARLLMGDDRRVAWLELPAMDRRRFEGKLRLIRDVQKKALAELGPRVVYVSTRDFFYDDRGQLRRKISDGKRRVPLRQDDGIHFSLKGSHYFADRVLPALLNEWGLVL